MVQQTRSAPSAPPPTEPQPGLDQAPAPRPAPPVAPKPPTMVDLAAHVRDEEGFEVEITLRNVLYESLDGTAVRAKTFLAALKKAGLTSAPTAPTIVAGGGGGGSGAGYSGDAYLQVNEDGSRTCSVHGPANFLAETVKDGRRLPGRWLCKDRGCKAKEKRE